MSRTDVLRHGPGRALAALPFLALAALAVLAITIRSEAVPGRIAAATPEPDAALKQQCIAGVAVGAGNDGLAADCALLLGAKDPLRGTETLNWSAGTAIASWEGITVAGSPLRVTRLEIDGWNSEQQIGREILLSGTIPAALGGLSKLQWLTLSRNALTGNIPAELAHLSALTSLQMYSNQLTGGIPPELGLLANLTYGLDLSRNQLTGGIPVELGTLSNLTSLRLHNNQLTGSIPVALGDLPNLRQMNLAGNTGLTGCIPESLRTTRINDLGTLGLAYCTTTTTHTLTTSATGSGRVTPLAGTYSYLSGDSVTVTATPDEGFDIASWGGDCSGTATTCTLTMSTDRTASVTFEQSAHTLTVTGTGTGTVTPDGTTTQDHGDEVTLSARWDDATHDFAWGGACAGTTGSTCVLTMDADKAVTATFTELPATRCATTTASDCIRAVYLGAPGDYAQVADIPADVLLAPASDGRYYVERGQQVTVVTAAQLPEGWTRFWLERTPIGPPWPVSASQLVPPALTTYTFTVATDEAAATLITYDLTAAKPHPVRPTHKPVLGAVVVTTVFSVEATTFHYSSYDTTGMVATAGSYAFLSDPDDTTTAVTTYEALRDGTTTGLIIHKADAHGASQAALFDAVETGDLFEWHKADDCFVRYTIDEVMTDPTGPVPRKLLAVEWMTYAFTGCSGAIPAGAASAAFTWGPANLQSPDIIVPIRHGPWQLVPGDWAGAIEPQTLAPGRGEIVRPAETFDMAQARRHRLWRDPALPDGWRLYEASVGFEGMDGVTAMYVDAEGYLALEVQIMQLNVLGVDWGATTIDSHVLVVETRTVDGRPAYVEYSPSDNRIYSTLVRIHDESTGIEYLVIGIAPSLRGRAIDATIEIARSLYQAAGQ